MSSIMYLLSFLLMIIISIQLPSFKLNDLYVSCELLDLNSYWVITCLITLIFVGIVYFLNRPRPIYLVNFSCYKPGDGCKCSNKRGLEAMNRANTFTKESIEFMKKVLEKSGIGEEAYGPEAILRDPPNPSLAEAIKEVETLAFGALDELFAKTTLNPKDIGILVVNCGSLCPTPSISAMVVNHYKLRSNIMSYNLGGMGCSAGLISIDLAKNLLQVHKNTYALVVSVEPGTLISYYGNERSMLVMNCLLRVGTAAILLSNKRCDRGRSKYELVHTVRTHKGADDEAFTCVNQREDAEGKIGISLSKNLMTVAGNALKENITMLGPLVLPFSEQFYFIATLVAKKMFNMKVKPYVPDFKLAFEHFCIHPGGKAVLDEVQQKLKLTEKDMEPSRMTLYRFGNTSSNSTWYELAYIEAKGLVKKGDRIWQIGFGSGFKCNTAVWRAIRATKPTNERNPWGDEIHLFPLRAPTSVENVEDKKRK